MLRITDFQDRGQVLQGARLVVVFEEDLHAKGFKASNPCPEPVSMGAQPAVTGSRRRLRH